jgi:hypothetical protein
MSHRPNDTFVFEGISGRPWYAVGGKTSDRNLEQRINIRFCLMIGKGASETLALLTVAYGEYALKKSSVAEWHSQIKEGRENVKDDSRSGQPKTERTDTNVDRVRTLVSSDRRVGVRVMAEELNMNRETVRQIVKEDLGVGHLRSATLPPGDGLLMPETCRGILIQSTKNKQCLELVIVCTHNPDVASQSGRPTFSVLN